MPRSRMCEKHASPALPGLARIRHPSQQPPFSLKTTSLHETLTEVRRLEPLDKLNRVPRAKGGVTQKFDRFAIPQYVIFAFEILMHLQPLDENYRRQVRILCELQQNKMNVSGGVRSDIEGNDLNRNLSLLFSLQNSAELSSHHGRPADRPVQHSLIQQHSVTRPVVFLQ